MTLEIGRAVSDGLRRAVKPNGLLLMALFVVLGFVGTLASQSLLSVYFESMASEFPSSTTGSGFPPATPLGVLPLGVAAVVAIVMAFVSEAVRIVGIRTFVSDATETIPAEYRRRNLPLATINGVVGGIVAGFLVGIGTIFLIIPGIFLAMSFFFFRQEIAINDRNFVSALSESWSIASGNRFPLFLLAIVVFVIGLVASIPGFIAGFVFGNGAIPTALVNVLINGVVTVLGMAIAARAYVQLTDEGGSAAGGEDDDGTEAGPRENAAAGTDESGIPLADSEGVESGEAAESGEDDDNEWNDPPGVDI